MAGIEGERGIGKEIGSDDHLGHPCFFFFFIFLFFLFFKQKGSNERNRVAKVEGKGKRFMLRIE